MITRNRTLSVVAALVATTVAGTAPALGAFDASDPNPLRQGSLIRSGDIAASGETAAIGYREGSSLFVTFSKDGGATYLKGNGNPRRFPVAGLGKLGIALDVCDDTIWVASAANFPGDRANDSDVLVSRRIIDVGAGQAFVTSPSKPRAVRSPEVACVGQDFVAVAWLERISGETRARLVIQDQASLAPAAFKRSFNLGKANIKSGIALAATKDGVYVAWARGKKRNLKFQRFGIGAGDNPDIDQGPIQKVADEDAIWPRLTSRGDRVAIAYTDAGRVKMRLSADGGKSFDAPDTIIRSGKKAKPSRSHSIALRSDRIVIEASRNKGGTIDPVRVQTFDLGAKWKTTSFGHKGARYGALQALPDSASSLKEVWHNNGVSKDTLRGQYEN